MWLASDDLTGKGQLVTDLNPWYDFRRQLAERLAADLIGGPADHTLGEPPLDRFVLGILHPQTQLTLDDEQAESEDATQEGAADAVFDPAVALSHMRYPSSAGMTFAADAGRTSAVLVDVSAARYRAKEDSNDWVREAFFCEGVEIGIARPGTRHVELTDGLEMYAVVRPPVEGVTSITLALLNTTPYAGTGRRDELCWFQPTLAVRPDSGWFVPRRSPAPTALDDSDLDSYALLYRDVDDLAVGHGCAVAWEGLGRVDRLELTFMPWHDVPLAEPSGGSGIRLPMEAFGAGEGLDRLDGLVEDYRAWIARGRERIGELPSQVRATAERHLDDATEAADRIAGGITLLRGDEVAARAFRLMNRAMELQRTRQDHQRGATPAAQSWRPFQMAFILMNLEGLTNEDSAERQIADLLWFPTGGGKTEAYLGLIGYSILLRRLRNPNHGGVSVIMRYTLRLLTVQQFERAAGLICALESIRRSEIPQAVEVSLGLWVGQAATPNSVKDARSALLELERGQIPSKGNPRQLLRCPVCGSDLQYDDYKFFKSPDRMVVRCPATNCEYHDGLPVHLVDEDVYRERPSLVIGTVDKFAMMAWRESVRNLFSRDGENPPPDLIIQDELHLISGPLGTMVGLYETAVDAGCTGTARPKIVASTATIRRAAKQVRAVFDRPSRQFPPPGIDAHDSYFAVDASPAAKGTRRYLGIAAPSTSHTTLMVRTYAVLLQAGQDLPADDDVRDAYWTLLGYFNSLRVLGGAFMQVLDDVPDRLKVLAGRMGTEPRPLNQPGELTSRKESAEIPEELARLGQSFPDPASPDVVLATNMISVGVDVDRLGLMVVMGQPQTTAEYIQATSRVGRKHPGLVVVLYNAARSRDLSHFENFGGYHRALYRQVEATGATPFAVRARDRGLHGMLVSLVRLTVDQLAEDQAAAKVGDYEAELEQVKESILERVDRIAPEQRRRVDQQLSELLERWREAAAAGQLKYPGWFDATNALLQDAGAVLQSQESAFPVSEPAWPTMTSLRDVDATCGLYLVSQTK